MEPHDLEWKSEIANAKLGVAEDFGWFCSSIAATAVWLLFEWWIGLLLFPAVYYILTLPYRREAAKAEDVYFRYAKIGRYSP